MQIQYFAPDQLIPYDKNPRKNDDAVDGIVKSIERYGFQNPIIVDKDMVLITGHTRLKAAKKMGLAQVPVIVAADLPADKVREYRLADNKLGEKASWDMKLLEEELIAIKDYAPTESDLGFDMGTFGFKKYADQKQSPTLEIKNIYQVVLELEDESEQKKLYEEMKRRNIPCKVQTLLA